MQESKIDCEIAQKTIDILNEYGWTQGAARNTEGAYCLYGAISVAIPDRYPSYHRAGFTHLLQTYLGMNLIVWNDTPGRTKAEVIAQLERICDGR